jgi:hypothetical protein
MVSDLTRLLVYERRDHSRSYAKCYRAAVSMHCHTNHSRESLSFLPHYASGVPILSRFYKSEMKRYGESIDFTRVVDAADEGPASLRDGSSAYHRRHL